MPSLHGVFFQVNHTRKGSGYTMADIQALTREWQAPALPESIPQGDMPGDKICITEEHRRKAETLFPKLKQLLWETLSHHPHQRAVVAVCGGSGVGKSEIASLLSYYLNQLGVGSYTLSGDNYPHRIPRDNDAERLRVFREGGLRGLIAAGVYTREIVDTLRELWTRDTDAQADVAEDYPWLAVYQRPAAGAWENTWHGKGNRLPAGIGHYRPLQARGGFPAPEAHGPGNHGTVVRPGGCAPGAGAGH